MRNVIDYCSFEIRFREYAEFSSWQAGYLLMDKASRWVWVKNKSKATIKKVIVSAEQMNAILNRKSNMRAAGYLINFNVENLNSSNDASNDKTNEIHVPVANISTPSEKMPYRSNSIDRPSPVIENGLDHILLKLLKPHQLKAFEFITERLFAEVAASSLPWTGAILADDMGTGKTLTSLAVVHSLCKHGKRKCVVVCPSTLIDNWRNEIKTWFPDSLNRTTVYMAGGRSNSSKAGY